jgi:HTH-type transcriptional regulator, sugar sensing transcriptional regulator
MLPLVKTLKNLGFTDKEAGVYLAALELGEASVSQLARESGYKRTSLYPLLEGLQERGAVAKTRIKKQVRYIPEPPAALFARAKENLSEFEAALPDLEEYRTSIYPKSRVYYLYGVSGFKQLWDKVFASKEREYRIITQGENFLDFVKEKYILNEIIKRKRELGIKSKQLITDSEYARSIIAKDARENRVSKILPAYYKLPFTEIVCGNFVAFIPPRFEEFIFIIEDGHFAKTRSSLFALNYETPFFHTNQVN